MAHRDIIVIGASLGGVQALPRLVAALPADLAAAVLIVMHMAAEGSNHLAERLDAVGPLQAAPAVDGEPITPGRIYVAGPDRHLMFEGNRIRVTRGPRESHARPSVDVLFRSAAFRFGPRVIGIVLTGMLDDGTAGSWAIKDRGGIVMIQSPAEAAYPSMPRSVARQVQVDYTLTLAEIPEILRTLTRDELHDQEAEGVPNEKLEIENRIALEDDAFRMGVRSLGQPSFHTCPECHGSMVAIEEGSIRRFRCHAGHGYTAGSLAQPRIAADKDPALSRVERGHHP